AAVPCWLSPGPAVANVRAYLIDWGRALHADSFRPVARSGLGLLELLLELCATRRRAGPRSLERHAPGDVGEPRQQRVPGGRERRHDCPRLQRPAGEP